MIFGGIKRASGRPMVCAALAAVLLAGSCYAQTSTVTLTFEGLQDEEPIGNYYNGGLGGLGSGPGPNYGITFGSAALAIVSQATGGSGNFSGNPSGNTTGFFLSGGGLIMNVAGGFTGGFSFYYAAAFSGGVVTVYSGANGTGTVISTLTLPVTGDKCNPLYDFSCWTSQGVSFNGVAMSVNFSGTANQIAFDNITLGSSVATNLSITTGSLPSGVVNVAYTSTTLQASGGKAPYTWSATGLPTGLSINATTGVLSGTPTQSGTFSVKVTVKDSTSEVPLTASQTYTLTIVAPLTITTASLPSGTINVAYTSTTLQASGGKTLYTWSATGLPAGLSLNATSGVLSGTPTQSGTFSVVVTVKDASSPTLTASQTYSLTISSGLTISTATLPGGILNVAYVSTTLQASGGKTPYTWSATGLPPGLSINASTGVLSGTPTQSGTFSVVVTVKDSSSPVLTASQTYSLPIVAGLTLGTTSLPGGTVNLAYPSTTLQANGGVTPYIWSATGLPAGLSINSTTGVLSGTPTQSGTFSVVVTVKDSSSPAQTVSQTYSLTIAAGLTITTTSLPGGTINVAYPSTTLQASGGKTPYTWSATGLPNGLSINASTGVLSGTPTQSGTFSVVVTLKDSSSPVATVSQTYSLTISTALTITTTSLPSGTTTVAYSSTTLQASGGKTPYTWSATGLPAGLSVNTTTGVLSGTPTAPGTFSVVVMAGDSSSPALTASQTYSLTIGVQPVQGITITQSATVSAPNQTSLLVSFGQAAPSAYTGTLSLSFQRDLSVTNVPANYVDPAGGFPVSGGSASLVQNFTLSQGTTQSSIQFGLGTVAGTWTVMLTALTTGGASALPSPAPTYTVLVAAAAPSITAGSVHIVNRTSSGFSVTLTGFATTRDVASATFTFTAASGASLSGTSVTVPFNGLDQSQWFNTTGGQSAGGTFSLTVPFGYSGDSSALGSVTVTLIDARGQTSAAVSGT
jgi:hypothetical protein